MGGGGGGGGGVGAGGWGLFMAGEQPATPRTGPAMVASQASNKGPKWAFLEGASSCMGFLVRLRAFLVNGYPRSTREVEGPSRPSSHFFSLFFGYGFRH